MRVCPTVIIYFTSFIKAITLTSVISCFWSDEVDRLERSCQLAVRPEMAIDYVHMGNLRNPIRFVRGLDIFLRHGPAQRMTVVNAFLPSDRSKTQAMVEWR